LVRTIDARQASGTAWHRAQALHRAHYSQWTRELGAVFNFIELQGGFPTRARLVDCRDKEQALRAARSLSGCTLEHVEVSEDQPGARAVLDQLPLLKSLTVGAHSHLADEFSARLEALDTSRLSRRDYPNLRRLVLRVTTPADLLSLTRATLPRLERLEVIDQKQRWAQVLKLWPSLACRRASLPPVLECERLDDGGLHAVLVGATRAELRKFVRAAPPGLRSVRVVGQRDDQSLAELQAALPKVAIAFLRP
jgi:hypothetical protein